MPWLSRLASLYRNLLGGARVERDLDDELRAYLDQLIAGKRAAGMGEAEARRSARIELGGLEQVKEQVRQVRTGRLLEELLQDLRYATRMLRKNPAFTVVALLTRALGIGANTAMFSVAYGILLRPLPYAGAGRVAVVCMSYSPRDFAFGAMCVRDYLMWKRNNRAFQDPSLFTSLNMDIGGQPGVPEQVQGASVTAGFFSTLAVRPLIGRTFAAAEDQPRRPCSGRPRRIHLAQAFRRASQRAGPGHPGERRAGYRDRRHARRIPLPLESRSLDQPAAESAVALRPLVLSRGGPPEARRHPAAGAVRTQPHRPAHDAAELFL